MIYIDPREVAADALTEINKTGAYNNVTLRKYLRQNGAMPKADRAFVTECVNGTLRNMIYIDHIINAFSKTKAEKMKPFICSVIRTAVYEIIFMDKVPDSAACSQAVELVKRRNFGKLSGFVNGVLRSVAKGWQTVEMPEKNTPEYLSVRYSHPLWIVKMWLSKYDFETVGKICEANNCAPDVCICVNTLKTSAGELKKMLEEKGISVKEGIYEKNALHLKGISNVAEMQEFRDGLFHVQDESSMLAVDVLDPAANEKILDVCAAPGGKSFYAAERMGGAGRVVSCDIYPHKTELISVTADRLGLGIIETRLRDASVLNEDDREKYDRVIIDAPCSGLGIIRKKPDIKINRTGEDIDSLIELQKRIIDASAECVKPGGLLVYSTCTICKKENEMNFKYILERGDFEPVDISKNLPEALKEFSGGGCVQLLPGINGTDGFFIAAARKKAL